MKKGMLCILAVMLVLTLVGACAEKADLLFEKLAGLEWSFSSGVGAWSTDLRIGGDGAFSGEFHDSEMGEAEEAYPLGTVYWCDFTGRLVVKAQVNETTWKLSVSALKTDESQPEETIGDGLRFVRAQPYGLSERDEMLLYAPGTQMQALPKEMRIWTHAEDIETVPGTLECWFLTSEKNESGFVSWEAECETAPAPSEWEDLTAQQLEEASGIVFGTLDGVQNISYSYLPGEHMAQMQFTWEEGDFCARIQPGTGSGEECPEISGMFFAWEDVEEVWIHGCRGTIGQAKCGSEDWVQRCLWQDAVRGWNACVSVSSTDLDGLDLTAIAEAVCYCGLQNEE